VTLLEICPCYGCCDRNEKCHTKGNCPHGYEEWAKEHKEYTDRIKEAKRAEIPRWTRAQEVRHFNWVKHGQGNSK
jgi:hypothetical protein